MEAVLARLARAERHLSAALFSVRFAPNADK